MQGKRINIEPFRDIYPFDSHFLDIDGLAYHYLDEGQGEPVVMLHGNPTWSFFYRELIKALSKTHRIIVPDHMGCGLSARPNLSEYDFRLASRIRDLECLLSHLGLDAGLTLIVHDWGGMIGSAYALRHQRRITRMIVMNTAAFHPPNGKPAPWQLRLIRDFELFGRLAVLGLNLFAKGAIHLAAHRRLEPKVSRGLLAPYNTPRNRLATLKFVQDIPLRRGDPSYGIVDWVDRHMEELIAIPLLLLWGKHDFVFDGDYFNEWRRRFPNAQAYCFEDAGHYLLEDVPQKIIPLIMDFLDARLQQ
jgi:haloalkane dehalogenase